MRYRCTHCSHVFELREQEFQRCPNCFWTTSLAPFQAEGEQKTVTEVSKPPVSEPSSPKWNAKPFVTFIILMVAVGTSLFLWFKAGRPIPKFAAQFPTEIPKAIWPKPDLSKVIPQPKPSKALDSFLTKEERTELSQSFQVTIPRKLSEDEEEILKKQVSFPANFAEKPKLEKWDKGDFEKMIKSEQDKRKIRLGWWYVRSLTKTFESHYAGAFDAYDAGNDELARALFIRTLSFPIYRNDVKFHRAVALVMLRPYINDVIGKIALINQYLLTQNLAAEVRALFESYEALFPVFELQEWDRALQLMEELKKKIEVFESRPQNTQVSYPPAFGLLDAEIQAAIQAEAAPKPEAAVNLKALQIDLGLKEKVVRQNTPGELVKIQKQYELAMQDLKEGDWLSARDSFRAIEHPPELAAEAKKKLA
ncbi:MAG: hypothetical protein HY584_03130, partial [Candidatus Omnitrophica bacterium]|nr:hypothetical protein [Candidatus Omnitrophota bacterium]